MTNGENAKVAAESILKVCEWTNEIGPTPPTPEQVDNLFERLGMGKTETIQRLVNLQHYIDHLIGLMLPLALLEERQNVEVATAAAAAEEAEATARDEAARKAS